MKWLGIYRKKGDHDVGARPLLLPTNNNRVIICESSNVVLALAKTT